MAQTTLPRLVASCVEISALTIFEDGSLSQESAERIQELVPISRLVRRRELNEFAFNSLKNSPNSQRYWMEHPLALKLLGIPPFLKFDFVFFDCDILFFHRFSMKASIFQKPDGFLFMKDLADGYSGRSIDFRSAGLKLLSRLNSGIMSIPECGYDIDFIEWFLGEPKFRNFPHLLEQSCWAAMPRSVPVRYIDNKQVWCAENHWKIKRETVGVHYIYNTKQRLISDAENHPFFSDQITPLNSISAPHLGFLRMIRNKVTRASRRG